jgi:hypothetical protein
MHRTVWAGAFAAWAAIGCGIDDFEEVITDEATLPRMQGSGTPLNAGYSGSFNSLELSKARNFENMGVKPGDVDGIYVKSIQLDMDSGSNSPQVDKLSIYVTSMELWAEAPGVARKTIARLDMAPDTKTADFAVEADFAPTAADAKGTGLKDYAVAESMQIGADVILTEAGSGTFLNITLKTTVTLLIDVNILGI